PLPVAANFYFGLCCSADCSDLPVSLDDREFCRSVVVRPESKGETSHRSRKLNGTFCEVPNRAAYTWPHITRDITRILIVPRQFLARFIGRSAQVRICTAAIFILLAGCG